MVAAVVVTEPHPSVGQEELAPRAALALDMQLVAAVAATWLSEAAGAQEYVSSDTIPWNLLKEAVA